MYISEPVLLEAVVAGLIAAFVSLMVAYGIGLFIPHIEFTQGIIALAMVSFFAGFGIYLFDELHRQES